jgi:hypothetical protein
MQSRLMIALGFTCTLLLALPPALHAADATDAASLMTRGKVASDLGKTEEAVALFDRVMSDDSAPKELRWEALVRIGIAKRAAGDGEGSVAAFEKVAKDYHGDADAMAFLYEAVTGVQPNKESWSEAGPRFMFQVDRTVEGRPTMRVTELAVLDPGDEGPMEVTLYDGPSPLAEPWSGNAVSLNLKDADYSEVIRLISLVSGMNVRPADDHVKLDGTITAALDNVPWDQAFAMMLQTRGLRAVRDGNTLLVYSDAPGARRWPRPAIDEADPQGSETRAAIRTVLIAVQAYRQDEGTLPAFEGVVDAGNLAPFVQPAYVMVLPRFDAWKRPLRYWSNGTTVVIASAGADGKLGDADISHLAWASPPDEGDDIISVWSAEAQ